MSEHKGRTYYFCSEFCRKKFEENPDKYAKLAKPIDIGTDISC
ncbi:MAG TPA: YHS domain-containing protein [Methanoregulaceae archaeon]|nr:YHS domain-containing protein [Methanoregulaceae archaeon]